MQKPSLSPLLVATASLALVFTFVPQVLAQQGSPAPAQDQNSASADDQSVTTLKVNVDVVQLFFNVKDKKGALIPNLTKDDF